jgi:hypothetical protein
MADLAGCTVAILVDDGFEKVEFVKPRQALDDAAPRPPSGSVASKRARGMRAPGNQGRGRRPPPSRSRRSSCEVGPAAEARRVKRHHNASYPTGAARQKRRPSAQALEQLGRPSERHQMVHSRSS